MVAPIFNNLKLKVSTYYDEKSSTLIHLRRLEYLCKMYLFLFDNQNQNFANLNEIKGLFTPK